MNDTEILEKLKEVLADVLPDKDHALVTAATRFGEELGLDSLKMFELVILTEDAFNIQFTGSLAFETVGEVMDYIREYK